MLDFVRQYESPYPATPPPSLFYLTLPYNITLSCYTSHELLLTCSSYSICNLSFPFLVTHAPPLFLLRPFERLHVSSPQPPLISRNIYSNPFYIELKRSKGDALLHFMALGSFLQQLQHFEGEGVGILLQHPQPFAIQRWALCTNNVVTSYFIQ